MHFNLNEFLIAISFALDFVEMDILGVATNHSKRVAYISMRVAKKLGFSSEEIFDTISLSILHDCGVGYKKLYQESIGNNKENLISIESKMEHCIKGEEIVKSYPSMTDANNIIKYHHENIDGTGFFNLKGDEIPIISQIIRLADLVELNFKLSEIYHEDKQKIRDFVKSHENTIFSPIIVGAFIEVCLAPYFWLDLKDEFINSSLRDNTPKFTMDITYDKIRELTKVLSKIIDSKSRFTQVHSKELSEKVAIMGRYYNYSKDEIYKLLIAADLHDIGKLAISNSIIDKPGKLDDREMDLIQQHVYYTKLSLQEIKGFEDITMWASNHHEKLNGLGYPYRKEAKELDFNSRLLACLDVYQALTEERPYRNPLSHDAAIGILNKMVEDGSLDERITDDVMEIFAR